MRVGWCVSTNDHTYFTGQQNIFLGNLVAFTIWHLEPHEVVGRIELPFIARCIENLANRHLFSNAHNDCLEREKGRILINRFGYHSGSEVC